MTPPLHVLLVDDDPAEQVLVELLLQAQPHPHRLTAVTGGDAALRFLQGAPAAPDLVLLDIEMPGMDGFEVLEHLKAHPAWRLIPVVMLTSNDWDEDVQRAYDLQASGYLVKAVHPGQSARQMEAFLTFWMGAQLPTRLGSGLFPHRPR